MVAEGRVLSAEAGKSHRDRASCCREGVGSNGEEETGLCFSAVPHSSECG